MTRIGGASGRMALSAALGCGFAGAILAVGYSCVPADTRPPPTTLTMTVSPSEAVTSGVTTSDGWQIKFDRVFVVLGNESLSDSCTVYGEADYDRVIDLAAGADQKLGIVHGVGACDLRFRAGPPSTDAVLGALVTQADKTALETPEPDPYSAPPPGPGPGPGPGAGSFGGPSGGSGTAFDISGSAKRIRDGVTKTFHLVYRRRVRYQRCTASTPPADASFGVLNDTAAFSDSGSSFDFGENQTAVFDLRIEAEAMFRDDPNPSAAALRFEPFASADVDGDGVVTLDELRAVPISSIQDAGAFEAGTYDVDDAGLLLRGRPIVIESLGDFVYELLLPTLPRFRGSGWCVSTGNRRPD